MNNSMFIIAFFLTIFLVPWVRRLAIKLNIVDVPNERKVHVKPKPYLGGLAIYLSTLITHLLFNQFYMSTQDYIIWGVGGILLLIGVYDDKFDMRARYKLVGQVLVAVVASIFLDHISYITIGVHTIYFNTFTATLIQAFWILVIMNAFNLIDGLDGLSSGLGLISLVFTFFMMLITGDSIYIGYVAIMIGALLGFLYHNFYPSSIFLGDAGSMFIGYYIAIISFTGYKTATLTTVSVLILVAAMPLLDILLAIIRRKRNKKKIFSADDMHFHHRLLRHGYSQTKAVIIMYIIMTFYGVSALLLSFLNNPKLLTVYAIFMLIVTELIIEYLYMLSDKFTIIRKAINKIKK